MAISRRAAISELLRAVVVTASAVVALLGARAARPAPARRSALELLPEDVTQPIVIGDTLLVPMEDGRVRAWSRRCTHLGCTVALDPDGKGLTCPCHGSRFDLRGRPTAGPASSGLRELEVSRTADGKLQIG